jgi:hypothetical protein
LWINEQKAIRARDRDGDSMNRILSWDKINQSCWIPTPKVPDLTKAYGLEMLIHQWWAIAVLRVRSIEVQGDSTRLLFHQPESRIQSEHPWPSPWISKKTGNSAFYLSNAIQFLNQPGEWYLDVLHQQLYYWPKEGQDMRTATVTAPYLETLVRMEGVADAPVAHVHFKGISFQHSSWMRPSQQGHVPLQAGMYLLDAYHLDKPGTPDKKGLENQAWTGRPAAAVSVAYANHTGFEQCTFTHMAATGLDYVKGTSDDEIKANVFTDIGGTGIQVGTFTEDAVEAHLPYAPADERIICTNTSIQNNLVYNCTNEDWGCVGIGAGFVKGINIAHNEIADVSYSGISLGWGWTRTVNVMRNNRISANYIHHYAKWMYDVAGIYTLSAQPGSVISNNCIDSIYKAPYAHLPEHWFYLYTDEGTSYITVKDNWCPEEKFLQNANGPGNTWSNNGPNVADSIKQSAGLEPAYRYLHRGQQLSVPGWPINHHNAKSPYAIMPSVIECIGVTSGNQATLRQLILQQGLDTGALYQWKDHVILFQHLSNAGTIATTIRQQLPGVTVKTYQQPFYEFNRVLCNDPHIASEWSHTILTANLVADTVLQQQYLQYHATQFTQWPEISKGFCNADFQRLLLYRNGRQLMLVISIPKGKSLDELNPRTAAGNPRVDDWNRIMQQYQEGIAGTAKGDVWVELKKQ